MHRNNRLPSPIPRRPSAALLVLVVLLLPACAGHATPEPVPEAEPAPAAAHRPAHDPRAWAAHTRPELPPDRPLRVAFLVVDGVSNSELMAPYDVFQHTRFHTGEAPAMEVFTVSPDGEPVRTFEGLTLVPHHGFADAPAADVLVVPSTEGSMDRDLADEELIAWVRETGAKARWIVSLCDGAFVLAKAGLLDGRAATTFPADYDRFAQLFPAVDLRVNVSFVHDGKALTSQGGARSYDVAMYLVDALYGPEVAAGVGRGLLIPWPPDLDTAPAFAVVPGSGS
ncbi:MAG TPA: DJ-1/PfpI family protein [Thermoanaerobaculia bacterium]|nr:DJ-1/PfpI family protein [Thermoanaerobaculia bacterium]